MRARAIRTFSWRQMSRWIRTNRLEIVDRGRWGPRWVHWLIWRAAMNTGMIRHMIVDEPALSFAEISDAELFKGINDQALSFLREDFRRNDLIVLVGNEQLRKLVTDNRNYTTFAGRATPQYGHSDYGMRLMDMPVYMLPHMDGFLVLPRSAIQ